MSEIKLRCYLSMDKLFVDLHVHTTFSDGTFTPEQIIKYAQDVGICAVSITDHDITDGIIPAIKEGTKRGIEIIPGVELSVELKNSSEGEMHILGYFINWENEQFQEQLKLFRQVRERRAVHILNKLHQLGIKLDQRKVFETAGIGSIGRLHIARVMLEEGYVKTIQEAFQKYLGCGKPAYVPKLQLKPQEAIRMIKRIGGIPVLAHPYYGNYYNKNLVGYLVKLGLKGIEAWHSKHPPKVEENIIKLADEFELIVTGGSDCHGALANEKPLIGTQKISYAILANLKKTKYELDRSSRHILT